jgi:hypothetical protein
VSLRLSCCGRCRQCSAMDCVLRQFPPGQTKNFPPCDGDGGLDGSIKLIINPLHTRCLPALSFPATRSRARCCHHSGTGVVFTSRAVSLPFRSCARKPILSRSSQLRQRRHLVHHILLQADRRLLFSTLSLYLIHPGTPLSCHPLPSHLHCSIVHQRLTYSFLLLRSSLRYGNPILS